MSHARAGWRRDAALAALLLCALAALAGLRPLMLPDEGRYAGVAWEMLRSGDWLTPRLDGLPYFHKPPLFYWIDAAAMAMVGANPWAARAAPLLGANLFQRHAEHFSGGGAMHVGAGGEGAQKTLIPG